MADLWRQSDLLDPARADALCATLGLASLSDTDAPLPPFFHQIYFWDARPPSELGQDGHPKLGKPIPDLGLPRRMWAGGRLEFRQPLRLGTTAEKRTFVEETVHKSGRSGPLGFVTLRHEIYQGDTLCVTEWQDLVYRSAYDPAASKPAVPTCDETPETMSEAQFSTTDLFRYSALTFNGHRIHYDIDYARKAEGYAGLVVHGPLLAQSLMLKAEDELGSLDTFAFRATAPLIAGESAMLCRAGRKLWVEGPDGRLCMKAEA